jgi:hypothetical protein
MLSPAAIRAAGGKARTGQAMVETVIALLFVFFAFLAVFQYVDNLRAKMLLEYAAFRCARARTVGYNDYKLLKTARLATISAAGKSLVKDESGDRLSTGDILARMRTYLSSRDDGAARNILDFDYWNDGRTPMPDVQLTGGKIEVETQQLRPQFFDMSSYFDGGRAVYSPSAGNHGDEPEMDLRGSAAIEAHYPDYLQ